MVATSNGVNIIQISSSTFTTVSSNSIYNTNCNGISVVVIGSNELCSNITASTLANVSLTYVLDTSFCRS